MASGLIRRPPPKFIRLLPRASPCQLWSRSFASENGDLVDAAVPFMGESINDGTLATFLKSIRQKLTTHYPGDRVEVDESIAQIETDKVTIDVNCPEAGIIQKFIAKEGDTLTSGTKIAVISKSSPGDTYSPQPGPPAEKIDKQVLKVSSAVFPKSSPSEPQLTPQGKGKTKKHGVKLGLMSGFVKVAVSGLQNQPIINSVIDRDDIVCRDYIDIGIAVGTQKSAILGMHFILSRPMVVDGNIVPRPVMYIALTYDHRLNDGRDAILFLQCIKDVVENQRRLLLDL
ncbi:hypothetical protein MUK42_33265 [Musa troglodytarum]|uniref:Dihydrolipoamide acetyltransferase component of pyruvate dehydrogenase complex n=1 Tax=Musa troglodytarum TaxID=320322 RepID=A0A9E7I134_9LILI|nr:hypothetical protein MUK42_33265 [Musa troglodytarum]